MLSNFRKGDPSWLITLDFSSVVLNGDRPPAVLNEEVKSQCFFFCRSLIDLRIPLTAHRLNTRWIFALTLIVKPRPHPEMLLFLCNVTCNCSVLSQLQE